MRALKLQYIYIFLIIWPVWYSNGVQDSLSTFDFTGSEDQDRTEGGQPPVARCCRRLLEKRLTDNNMQTNTLHLKVRII